MQIDIGSADPFFLPNLKMDAARSSESRHLSDRDTLHHIPAESNRWSQSVESEI
jgi:hypothetical protein